MAYYKVGKHINLKRQKFLDEVANSLFWAALVLAFLYCLYA